ncbi:whirlin-like [Glandiceps talaboti]
MSVPTLPRSMYTSRSWRDPSPQPIGRRTLSTNVRRLHDALNNLLDEGDRAYFVHALNDYHARRNVYDLVQALRVVLDTPEKKYLFVLLEQVVPTSDHVRYKQYTDGLYPRSGFVNRSSSLPPRGRTPLPRSSQQQQHQRTVEPHGKTVKRSSGQKFSSDAYKDVRRIILKKAPNVSDGLGFSIRGGSEHGIGIFISIVEAESTAERIGLQAGDQILLANDIPFERISHAEAARILKKAQKLSLLIKSVGRVPGSYVSHQTYTWVDPHGRSVSPPPDIDVRGYRGNDSVGRRSGLNLLKDGDERKVHLVVEDGQSLGLMIRGGAEFGLGIYITGVDAFSVAEYAGLKVGDQILDINGTSFLSIEHQEAANILKSSKLMVMTVKDVGKLPYARTTFDQTKWIMGDQLSQMSEGMRSRSSSVLSNRMTNGDSLMNGQSREYNSKFTKGVAGTQLMWNTSLSTQSWSMMEEQARHLLNENERGTMKYYLDEYQNGHISIDDLVMALFELLNTHSKFSLLAEVRTFIVPRDIDRFDTLVLKREVQAMKARQHDGFIADRTSMNSFGETMSSASHYSSASIDSRPITPPKVPQELPPNIKMSYDHNYYESHNGTNANHINDDTEGLPDFQMPEFDESPPHTFKPRPIIANKQTVTVDIHHHIETVNNHGNKFQDPLYDDTKSPSEDSGVDVHLGALSTTRTKENRPKKSLTISPTPPITINDTLRDPIPESPSSTSTTSDDHNASWESTNSSSSHVVHKKRHSVDIERRHSFDSVTTESSTHSSVSRKILLCLGHLNPPTTINFNRSQRISDPTHHVPKDQQRRVARTKKASETLYELKRQPPSPSISPRPSSPAGDEVNQIVKKKPLQRTQAEVIIHRSPTPSPTPPGEIITIRRRSPSPGRPMTLDIKPKVFETFSAKKESTSEKRQSRSHHREHSYSFTRTPSPPRLGINSGPPSLPRSRSSSESSSESLNGTLKGTLTRNNVPSISTEDVSKKTVVGERREVIVIEKTPPASREGTLTRNGKVYDEEEESTPVPKPRHKPPKPPKPSIKSEVKEESVTRAVINYESRENINAAETSSNSEPPVVSINTSAIEAPTKYSEDVVIRKSKPTLGIAVEGGAGTKQPLPKVINIQYGGSAYHNSNLKRGHVILSVNGKSLKGLAHRDAAKILAGAFKDKTTDIMELVVIDSNKYPVQYY